MLKALYSVFIGILVVSFIGFGVAAFYPAPESPEPPQAPLTTPDDSENRGDQTEAQQEYEQRLEEHRQDRSEYVRNISVILVLLSILVLVIGLMSLSGLSVVDDGLLIGGILTLLYGVGRSFEAGDERLTFAAIAVSLVTAIVVGYKKFAETSHK